MNLLNKELETAEAGMKALDAPSEEEKAKQRAQMQEEVTAMLDAQLQELRQSLLDQNWEQAAKQYEVQYQQWTQQQTAQGRPIMAPGQWYATEVLLKQAGSALLTGQLGPQPGTTGKRWGQPPVPCIAPLLLPTQTGAGLPRGNPSGHSATMPTQNGNLANQARGRDRTPRRGETAAEQMWEHPGEAADSDV